MVNLTLTWVNGKDWFVVEPMTIIWNSKKITVPIGAKTNLASVPWWARWLISVSGNWNRGAVIHDYLYDTQPNYWTRKQADDLLYDISKIDGTSIINAYIIWLAVRIGGPRWRK